MLPAFAIAADGLAVQSRKLEGVALVVALQGTQQAPSSTPAIDASPVRVRTLPVGDPLESLVTMKEAELAYRMNAAVLSTAGEMLDTLLDALDRDTR